MKYRKLFPVILLISLLPLADINARTRRRSRPKKARTERKHKLGKIKNIEFNKRYNFSVPGKTSKIKFVVNLPKTIPNKQKILTIKYSPEPTKVFSKNRNDYAEFTFVEPKRKFTVEINVKAKLFRYDLSTAQQRYKEDPPIDPNLNDFLKHEKYIEKDNPKIQQIARTIKGLNDTMIVKNIYNHVIDNMEYGGYNPKSQGALEAIQQKSGDCSEYSDLFAAVCRAKNIPARVVSGYTTNFNNTPKHSWVEVYLKTYGWVPFDPTRGDKEDTLLRKKRFHTLEPIYIYLSHIRNDKVLNNYSFSHWRYWGSKISVEDSIEFK